MRTYARAGHATFICPEIRSLHDEHGDGLPDASDEGGHRHLVVAFLPGDQEYEPPSCSCGRELELHALHRWEGIGRGELLKPSLEGWLDE